MVRALTDTKIVPNVLDDNLYRTIMIDFIPFGTPYSDVLQQIRGGKVELIQMYGPIGDVTNFVTARVIYTDENGATALYRVSCLAYIYCHADQFP